MNNRYFQLSDKGKKIFRLKLLSSSLLLILLIGLIIIILSPKLGFLIIVPISMMILIIAPFFDVPSLIENGQLKYYSLFLLAEQEKDGIITIHGGTLFDYYFVFQKEMSLSLIHI